MLLSVHTVHIGGRTEAVVIRERKETPVRRTSEPRLVQVIEARPPRGHQFVTEHKFDLLCRVTANCERYNLSLGIKDSINRDSNHFPIGAKLWRVILPFNQSFDYRRLLVFTVHPVCTVNANKHNEMPEIN